MKFDVTLQNTWYAPVPWRYLYNEYNWVTGTGQLWSNTTFTSLLSQAKANQNATTQVQILKQAELTLAQNAIVDGVVGIPQYIAYNHQQFTNISAAAQKDALNVLFWPSFGEDILTSAVPAGTATGTSTAVTSSALTSSTGVTATSTAVTSTTITSSTPASSSSQYSATGALALLVVVVVVFIAAVGVLVVRRGRPLK
jgi:hypothetical protein